MISESLLFTIEENFYPMTPWLYRKKKDGIVLLLFYFIYFNEFSVFEGVSGVGAVVFMI